MCVQYSNLTQYMVVITELPISETIGDRTISHACCGAFFCDSQCCFFLKKNKK
eukprot:JP443715.1.p2 GENE.JP443715.1~~JP443715.1.p2  ORF type:complete len:53 (+),score=4.29 JP443715.1:86-244(+)